MFCVFWLEPAWLKEAQTFGDAGPGTGPDFEKFLAFAWQLGWERHTTELKNIKRSHCKKAIMIDWLHTYVLTLWSESSQGSGRLMHCSMLLSAETSAFLDIGKFAIIVVITLVSAAPSLCRYTFCTGCGGFWFRTEFFWNLSLPCPEHLPWNVLVHTWNVHKISTQDTCMVCVFHLAKMHTSSPTQILGGP